MVLIWEFRDWLQAGNGFLLVLGSFRQRSQKLICIMCFVHWRNLLLRIDNSSGSYIPSYSKRFFKKLDIFIVCSNCNLAPVSHSQTLKMTEVVAWHIFFTIWVVVEYSKRIRNRMKTGNLVDRAQTVDLIAKKHMI